MGVPQRLESVDSATEAATLGDATRAIEPTARRDVSIQLAGMLVK